MVNRAKRSPLVDSPIRQHFRAFGSSRGLAEHKSTENVAHLTGFIDALLVNVS